MTKRLILDVEYVRSILHYAPKTGALTWKINRRPRGKKGQPAGCRNSDGYLVVGIDGAMYFGHRLAWLIKTGRWPTNQVDHKNGNTRDLRWNNLREATHAQNKQNQKPNKNNQAGRKGVYKRADCNRWCAMIQYENKVHYLGLFKTAEEASTAYKKAAKNLHKEFARFH